MIKLLDILRESELLQEELILYKVEVLIKTDASVNQVFIYNEIRGIKDVVVVTVQQNPYLQSLGKSGQYHFALLKIKFLTDDRPTETIEQIRTDCMQTHKIDGLLQFIPRMKTIEKVGQY